jgi:hypothetical protein
MSYRTAEWEFASRARAHLGAILRGKYRRTVSTFGTDAPTGRTDGGELLATVRLGRVPRNTWRLDVSPGVGGMAVVYATHLRRES